MKALLIAILALAGLPVLAEDWTTTDGKVYADVKVIRVEDDAVTIMFKQGGALVPLYKLPPSLQKRFSYDPAKAKIAAEARSKADAENAKALQKEIDQADSIKHQQQIKDEKAREAAASNISNAGTTPKSN